MVDIAVCFVTPGGACARQHTCFFQQPSRACLAMASAHLSQCQVRPRAAVSQRLSGRLSLDGVVSLLSSSLWPLDHIFAAILAAALALAARFTSVAASSSPAPSLAPANNRLGLLHRRLGLLQRRLPPLQRRLPPADDHSCGPTRSPATPLVANEGKPR